jgi:hypothetical protein
MEDEKIVLDGTEYLIKDLKPEEQYYVSQLKNLQEKEAKIKFESDQITVAKQSFSNLLVTSINQEPSEEE